MEKLEQILTDQCTDSKGLVKLSLSRNEKMSPESDASANGPGLNRTKKVKIRSVYWDYFYKAPDNPFKAVCQVCSKSLQCKQTTSCLIKHLRAKHPRLYSEAKAKEGNTTINPEYHNDYEEREQEPDSGSPGKVEQTVKMVKYRQSIVWNFFKQIHPQMAQCTLCGHVSRYIHGSTTTLLKHLKAKHWSHYQEAMSRKGPMFGKPAAGEDTELTKSPHSLTLTENKKDSSSKSDRASSSSTTQAAYLDKNISSHTAKFTPSPALPRKNAFKAKTKDRVDKSLIKLISVNLLPPSIVEIEEFKEMLKILESRYELPTKKTILKYLMPEFAEEIKKKLKADVDSTSHFALTVETWTYRHGQECVTVIAHFIKDSWEMSAVTLETIEFSEEKGKESLIQELRRITDEWGISDKVVSLVARDSEPLSTAALTMGWAFQTCLGERLNSVVTTALDLVPEVTKVLKRVNEVAEFFNKSLKAAERLLSVQKHHNLPERSLKTCTENELISTYHMVERMLDEYEAANTVLCHYGKDDMCLCDEEVELMQLVFNLLQPFEAILNEISNEESSSLSKVIPLINLLQQVVKSSDSDRMESLPSMSTFRNLLVQQLEAKFSELENNSALSLCTLLDPRFKHHGFSDSAAMKAAQDELLQEMTSLAGASSAPEETLQTSSTVAEDDDSAGDVGRNKKSRMMASSIWDIFDKRVSDAGVKKNVSSDVKNESHRYFQEAVISRNLDPLQWWKINQVLFPHLQMLAKKYLCVPTTSLCSSRLFSGKGEKFGYRRNLVKPKYLNTMIFLASNVKAI